MLNVDHRITIDGDVWSSTEHSRLIGLQVSASMNIPVNECQLQMTYPIGLSMEPEQEIEVELGHNGSLKTVFTGTIEAADWQIEQISIRAASAVRKLAGAKYNLYFDRPKAGDIVSALCKEADVDTAKVDPGIIFDFYAVGANLSAFEHIRRLALNNGFDLYTDPDDKLVFTLPIPGTPHDFQFGINILNLQLEHPQAQLSGISIYGESPTSLGQGPDAASWLTKKEVKGEAGDQSGIVKHIVEPAARSLQNAVLMAQARILKEKEKKHGRLKILGDSAIQLGDMALILLMPAEQQNGLYKITGITHSIHPIKGFVTILNIEEAI